MSLKWQNLCQGDEQLQHSAVWSNELGLQLAFFFLFVKQAFRNLSESYWLHWAVWSAHNPLPPIPSDVQLSRQEQLRRFPEIIGMLPNICTQTSD